MERLAGSDAIFLAMETANTPQHVAGLAVLDTPSVDVARLAEIIRRVLPLVPKFTRTVKSVPFHLDRPVWRDDPDFDVDRHIRRIAVPAPGGRREVGELLGQLMSVQLDRRLPLWELWVIEGLDNGRRSATFLKYHHALMDGKSGASLAELLFQLGPDDDVPEAEPLAPIHTPSGVELLVRSQLRSFSGAWNTAAYSAALVRRGVTMLRHHRRSENLPGGLSPSTVLTGAIGRRRQMAFSSLSLDDVKRIAKSQGVKVNDVVMTLVAATTRRYLIEVAQLPAEPLTAMMAVSTSLEGATGQGNKVASVPMVLPTHLADPVEQLRAVFNSTSQAKEMLAAVQAHDIQSIGAVAPPILINIASQGLARAEIGRRLPTVASLLVSNIPGPPIPLYQAGAKVLGIFSGSVLLANLGLNITLMSYAGHLDLGLTFNPDVITRADVFADALPVALAELMAALELGEPTQIADAWCSG